jgi:hypothetical protein
VTIEAKSRAPGRGEQWTTMHIISEAKPIKAQPRHQVTTKARPAKTDSVWKPQPCGLTRAELRRIVAELLG